MPYMNRSSYDSNIVVFDGISGSGKLLTAELCRCIFGFEPWTTEPILDYLLASVSTEQISHEVASSLLITRCNELIYNFQIGRSINLRFKDESSIFRHKSALAYILRLFQPPIDDNDFRYNKSSSIYLPLIVHCGSFGNDLFEKAYQSKAKMIYTLRNPLECIETYSSYLDKVGDDPREFTLSRKHQSGYIPWYAESVVDLYLDASDDEKSVLCISTLLSMLKGKVRRDPSKSLIITFESLVRVPDLVVESICNFLRIDSKQVDQKFLKTLKSRNALPRNNTGKTYGYWKNYSRKNHLSLNKFKAQEDIYDEITKRIRPVYKDFLDRSLKDYCDIAELGKIKI